MAGRGRSSILQALKEKKERERSESPSSVRQPLVTEPTPAVSAPAPTAAAAAVVVEETTISTGGLTAGQASTSGARVSIGRGVGRGQLASLLATRQPASTITAPPITSPEKVTQSIPKEPTTIEPFEPPMLQKTSTLREQPEQQTKPTLELSEPLIEPIKTMSRGRGRIMGRGMMPTSIPRDESPAPDVARVVEQPPLEPPPSLPPSTSQVLTQVESKLRKMTMEAEETKPPVASDVKAPTVTETETTIKTAPVRSDDGQQTVMTSTTGAGVGGGAACSSGYTRPATEGSLMLKRAEDELRIVERIERKSPVRKMGEAGERADFMTNYVKLRCNNKGVYQYVVHFEPAIDSQYHRIKMVYFLRELIGDVRLFDGVTLFLPILLKERVTIANVKRKVNSTEQEVQVRIQLTKILPPEQIPPPVFNMIFKNIMKELKMTRIGQHYFSPARQIDVSRQNLQIWPGYETAVHEFEDGLYLVMDVAHKVLRTHTCWDVMSMLYENSNQNMQTFRDAAAKALIGSVVLTKYNNKTYKVDDILWDSNPQATFMYHEKSITYMEYYKQHYDIEIKDREQPLLFHRPKAKAKQGQIQADTATAAGGATEVICLVPELCFMTGLSEELRADFNVKKDLSVHTRLSPEDRFKQLKALVDNIRNTPKANDELRKWGLDLGEDISRMPGRIMPPEKICFARREVETDAKCDWTRAAGNEEVLRAIELKHWMIVYPGSKEQIVARFCDLAYESGRKIGIRIQEPITVPLRDDRPDTYYNEIKRKLTSDNSIQMVVVILQMLSDSRYQRIKRLCCIEIPVPSQIIVAKTINKPDASLRSVAQKIILQMNVKLGGELWRLPIPIKKIMIVGIDVYHKIERGYKSIAGFVSSMNQDHTRWYSKVCFQMVGQELADTLKATFATALKKYNEANGFLPEKIIVFRDGVSEGQLSVVADHECEQLRSCFSVDYNPQMCVIVVQKRINTRIFSTSVNNNRSFGNPKPGTVIDHSITTKEWHDFFLVSQNVNQGTVTPTHYIVAFDSTTMKPDHIQRLSYKMTHMYYNWSGTIRVPAPCQYAHKLAFLTGQYLQEEAKEDLCDRLFYL